jgi:hypothetical protein
VRFEAGVAVNWKSIVSVLGSWVILASVALIVVYAVLGWAVAFRNRQVAITSSNIAAMRFTPIGVPGPQRPRPPGTPRLRSAGRSAWPASR